MDNIRDIMSTQLTEREVMVFLLVRGGKSYRDVADLPIGISYDTVGVLYRKAADKVQKMVEAGILDAELNPTHYDED